MTFMSPQNELIKEALRLAGDVSPLRGWEPVGGGMISQAARITTDGGWLVAELPSPSVVRAVDLRTRGHVVWLQQSVTVETSRDGVSWAVAAEEPSGGLAFVGALAEPKSLPVRVILPDPIAKFVRINGAPFGTAAITVYGLP